MISLKEMSMATKYKRGSCRFCRLPIPTHSFPVVYQLEREPKLYKSFLCVDHVDELLEIADKQGLTFPRISVTGLQRVG